MRLTGGVVEGGDVVMVRQNDGEDNDSCASAACACQCSGDCCGAVAAGLERTPHTTPSAPYAVLLCSVQTDSAH